MKNTKSLLALFLACMMVISCFVVTPVMAEDAGVWDEWDGTVDENWESTMGDDGAYHITTAEQLAGIAVSVNNGGEEMYKNIKFYLEANIRLNSEAAIAAFDTWGTDSAPELKAWTSIGTHDGAWHKFAGDFYGNGNTISGMYIPSGARVALFGGVDDSFNAYDLNITYSYVSGSCAGILAGQLDGGGTTIKNITVSNCKLNGTDGSGTGFILARPGGFGTLTLNNCDVADSVATAAGAGCAGIVANMPSGSFGTLNITSCDVTDTVFNGTTKCGALFGGNVQGTSGNRTLNISDCTVSNVDVNASSTENGGVVGVIWFNDTTGSVSIKNSTFDVDVKGTSTIGGVIGYLSYGSKLDVDGVTASGTVTASGNNDGGLVAIAANAPLVTTINNTHVGFTFTNAKERTGGYFGRYNNSTTSQPTSLTITNSSLTADVKSSHRAGGIIGDIEGLSPKNITIDGFTVGGNVVVSAHYKAGGLIGAMTGAGATVENFVIRNVTIMDKTISAVKEDVGALVGLAAPPITNLTIEGVTVEGVNLSGSNQVAGLIGALKSATNVTVSDCVVEANINSTASISGGMFAQLYAANVTIDECEIVPTLVSTSDSTGAIAGRIYTANAILNIKNSVFDGSVKNTGYAASLLGNIEASGMKITVEGCYISTDVDASGSNVAAIIGDNNQNDSVINVENCLVDANIKGTGNVGNVVGYGSHSSYYINVKNSVFLGGLEATGTDAKAGSIGLAAGVYNNNQYYTIPGTVTIDNVYFNPAYFRSGNTSITGPRLGTFNGICTTKGDATTCDGDGTKNIAEGYSYYMPGEDYTSACPASNIAGVTNTAEKRPNVEIANFVSSMKDIKNSDGSTPVWMGMDHTCNSVEMSEENGYDAKDTMTLGCEIPGCEHFHITNLGSKFGASVRTGENAGLRFGFRFNSELVNTDDVDVGILVIPTDLLTGELTVDTAKVQNVKAATCFPEGSKYYADGAYSFAGVLTGIPTGSFDREITARGYIVIDGVTYYTETAATTYRAIAEQAGVTIAE